MRAYKHPFGGQRAVGNRKAPRQKQFRKNKAKGDGDRSTGKTKSPWGLLGAVGSFAAVFIFTIWKSHEDGKTKRLSDTRILNTLMFKPMVYTDHAICRMKCRFVTEEDIQESLKSGKVNARKSDTRLRPCAKFVVDAKVGQGRRNIETVFSACPANTKVVTVIDQDTNWECYCP